MSMRVMVPFLASALNFPLFVVVFFRRALGIFVIVLYTHSDDGGEAVRPLPEVQHPGPDVEHPGGGAGDAAGGHILPRPRQRRPGTDGKQAVS